MRPINNNIPENFVSFLNAKLLKEKEFDVKCNAFYSTLLKDNHKATVTHDFEKNSNSSNYTYIAPTQQLAIDWIFENFNLLITIVPDNDSQYKLLLRTYTAIIWKFSNGINVQPTILRLDNKDIAFFVNPEKAKEAAITYALTNLKDEFGLK